MKIQDLTSDETAEIRRALLACNDRVPVALCPTCDEPGAFLRFMGGWWVMCKECRAITPTLPPQLRLIEGGARNGD